MCSKFLFVRGFLPWTCPERNVGAVPSRSTRSEAGHACLSEPMSHLRRPQAGHVDPQRHIVSSQIWGRGDATSPNDIDPELVEKRRKQAQNARELQTQIQQNKERREREKQNEERRRENLRPHRQTCGRRPTLRRGSHGMALQLRPRGNSPTRDRDAAVGVGGGATILCGAVTLD